MNELVYWNALVRLALVWVALSVQQGCGQTEPITSWESPRLLTIKKEWDSIARITTQDKSKYEELQSKLNRILRNNLSEDDLRQLAATCETLPIHENDQSLFTREILSYMVEVFVDLGDRDSLVKMLSTRCPVCIRGNEYIEYCLVSGKGKLKDPILILGTAYCKCRIPEVRSQIAIAVRRGFTRSGICGKDDTEFVNNAMQWYEKEKGHLVVNKAHHPFGSLAPEGSAYFQIPPYDKIQPLFVEKSPVPERKDE